MMKAEPPVDVPRDPPSMLEDGSIVARFTSGRLHLQHGPIDLLIQADGQPGAIDAGYQTACSTFDGLLDGLVAELATLRRPLPPKLDQRGMGETARRMIRAVAPFKDQFVTPMAAVAGAVADTVLEAMAKTPGLRRIQVNNRGDIALRAAPGERHRIGLVPELRRPLIRAHIELKGEDGIGGVATSGWDGRSFSLGIADAVTVLAKDAASADAAATLIANHVDEDHPAIIRLPASTLDPDSDLGERLVTTQLGPLPDPVIEEALRGGQRFAEACLARGLIRAAFLALQGRVRIVGEPLRGLEGAGGLPGTLPARDDGSSSKAGRDQNHG